jgi:hemoglobin
VTLFERLGGEPGITAIVDDFTQRALEDPRVNWERKGIKRGGLFGQDESRWTATPTNTARLKTHLVQFLSLATGGAPKYDGKEMKSAHAGLRISNPEFDATIGDLKASLDKLRIADKEQKELLAVIESTRPQIVTER